MALHLHKHIFNSTILHQSRALGSAVKTASSVPIKKSVFISQSNDVFANLAIEDWLYRHFDFTDHHVLMLWQNRPCVVIGRHQNPWLEANVAELASLSSATQNTSTPLSGPDAAGSTDAVGGVQLARRNSGGGAVYHDLGNLNMTFFTSRDRYDRRYNLELVRRALFRGFGLNVDVSEREDLTLRNFKVSGTAAKLGRPSAYHHCTLLVNADKATLRSALQKTTCEIKTNATKSMRSKILNLTDENPKIDIAPLVSALGWEYLRTDALQIKDGGLELAHRQQGFTMINPTEQWFPGLTALKEQLQSWDWCYGKTPKFTIDRTFSVPEHLLGNFVAQEAPQSCGNNLKITMTVDSGRITNVDLYMPEGLAAFSGHFGVITNLEGRKFSEDALEYLERTLGGLVSDRDKFLTDCVKQVMTSV